MTERWCKFCERMLSLDSFYVGKKWKCKKCINDENKRNRAANLEERRQYDRDRSKLPHRVEARKQYQQTEAYKVNRAKARLKYSENHPNKRKAITDANNAIKLSKLQRYPCIICGDPKSEGHHEDYDRPLDVTWLCDKHHKARHVQLREHERLGGEYPDVTSIPM